MKPEFFEDEKVQAVSIQARFVTIGLITRADDRGRQQHIEPGILGHVFPHGDVAVKQLRRWLAEIFGVGIIKTYDVGPFSYLWFPSFWRHQKINRPSESDLPPHPEDPYADWPIADAIKSFRREDGRDPVIDVFSELSTEPLTPSRGSVPFPSVSNSSTGGVARELIMEACAILAARWDPDEVAVENCAAMYPTVDLLQGCRLAVTWASDPSWEIDSCAATLRAAMRKLDSEKPKVKASTKRGLALDGLMAGREPVADVA